MTVMAALRPLLQKPAKTLVEALFLVLSSWPYRLLFLASSLVFAYAMLVFTSLPGQSFSSWWFSVSDATKFFVPVAALLLGLTTATQAYVWRHVQAGSLYQAKHTGVSLAAFLSAVVSTACCSPFIFTFIGLAGFASFLAAYQTQFILLALLLLVVSLYYSAKVLSCEDCRVKLDARLK